MKALLIGLLVLLPLGASAVSADIDYNSSLCEAFEYNTNPPFTVPAGGQYRLTIDMTHCGGFVQNYQVMVMGAKRHDTPSATLMILDATGHSVGVSDAGHHVVTIGTVPTYAVYTVVVTSGSKRSESCLLYCTGAI